MDEVTLSRQLQGFLTPHSDPTPQAAIERLPESTRAVVGRRVTTPIQALDDNNWATLGQVPANVAQADAWLLILHARRDQLMFQLAAGAPHGVRRHNWRIRIQTEVRNIRLRVAELNRYRVQLNTAPNPSARKRERTALALGEEPTDRVLLLATYQITQRILDEIRDREGDARSWLSDDDRAVLGYVAQLYKRSRRQEA